MAEKKMAIIDIDESEVIPMSNLVCTKCGGRFDLRSNWLMFLLGYFIGGLMTAYFFLR